MNQDRDIPVKRLIPQSSVFNIFHEIYSKEKHKDIFLNNHKYLKIREAYFSLFACRLFDDIEGCSHLLFFPEEERGDVIFACGDSNGMRGIVFDVKEFHEKDKNTFSEFLKEILNKKKVQTNAYGLIIVFHKNTNLLEDEVGKLLEASKKLTRGIFLVSNPHEEINEVNNARCRYLLNGKILKNEIVKIGNDGIEKIVIYEDEINFIET
jgi:hypothetical protein